MGFRVRTTPDLPPLTSRRRGGLVFTRQWFELEEVPESVLKDPRLQVERVKAPKKSPEKAAAASERSAAKAPAMAGRKK